MKRIVFIAASAPETQAFQGIAVDDVNVEDGMPAEKEENIRRGKRAAPTTSAAVRDDCRSIYRGKE